MPENSSIQAYILEGGYVLFFKIIWYVKCILYIRVLCVCVCFFVFCFVFVFVFVFFFFFLSLLQWIAAKQSGLLSVSMLMIIPIFAILCFHIFDKRDNYTLPTCGLPLIWLTYPWFQFWHFTHLWFPPLQCRKPTSPSAITLTHNMSKTKAQTDQNTPHSQNSLPSNPTCSPNEDPTQCNALRLRL